jgi:hypothetical protein
MFRKFGKGLLPCGVLAHVVPEKHASRSLFLEIRKKR